MILKPCPFCHKDIPRSITACPYCHRDEQGKPVVMDSAAVEINVSDRVFQADLKDLASDDPYTRDNAVARVSKHGAGVVQALMTVLGDFAKPNLSGVARVLGKIGDRRAIGILAQAAKLGDDDLRLSAVWALAQFNDPEALPYLLAEAERPHPIAQSYLASVLGSFQDARVVPVLSRLALHANREVAFQAAYALGESGGGPSIAALKAAWRKGDRLVRAACGAALRRLGARPSLISKTLIVWGIVLLVVAGAAAGYFFYK